MQELLFLCHRLPYPPDKGDKIRSWHLLRHLARDWRVHLGCFIDDERDLQFRDAVEDLCGECFFVRLRPRWARLRCLGALPFGPLTLAYFRSRALAAWADSLIEARRPAAALAFSSSMAPYLMRPRNGGLRRVLDMVDVDSDKWRQLAREAGAARRMIYAREARTLLAFERRAAASFDATVLASPAEVELFRRLAPEAAPRVHHVGNGVDTDYFSPDRLYPDPHDRGTVPLVFTGAMDYRPNIDAVRWFAAEILPLLRAGGLRVELVVVGANPTAEVLALAAKPGVKVTGRVDDVRPWLAHARAVVAPLRMARGVQNKVLEAMAMARPVVATPQAVQGVDAEPGVHLLVAERPDAFAAAVADALAGPEAAEMGRRARRRVLAAHSWSSTLAALDRIVAGWAEPGLRREAAGA